MQFLQCCFPTSSHARHSVWTRSRYVMQVKFTCSTIDNLSEFGFFYPEFEIFRENAYKAKIQGTAWSLSTAEAHRVRPKHSETGVSVDDVRRKRYGGLTDRERTRRYVRRQKALGEVASRDSSAGNDGATLIDRSRLNRHSSRQPSRAEGRTEKGHEAGGVAVITRGDVSGRPEPGKASLDGMQPAEAWRLSAPLRKLKWPIQTLSSRHRSYSRQR
jgi:hypothetical protein